MSNIGGCVDVDVPVRVAYDQWTQFETFPKFVEGVASVEQLIVVDPSSTGDEKVVTDNDIPR
jgi:uncharacterized membrane protein